MAYERDYKITKTIHDLYKFYKEITKDPLSERLFKDIVYDINKEVSDLVISRSFEYRLPYRLGYLRIKKRKLRLKIKNGRIDVNKNMVDWKSTFDYWQDKYGTRDRKVLRDIKDKKRIYQLNEHTNGDIMKWFWDKHLCNVPNSSVYKFKPVKGGYNEKYIGRLGLGEKIKEGYTDYYY